MKPLFETETIDKISPEGLDERLARGWRHFGTDFFRTNLGTVDSVFCGVMPLRVRIDSFRPSKSHRRILKRNTDTEVRFAPAEHCSAYDTMFESHKSRFRENVPAGLRDFLSPNPSTIPCRTFALEVWTGGRIAAVSFVDLGARTASSVYAMFDPAHSRRSLGIFTLLMEVEEARRMRMEHLYLGYAYTVSSVYDYKKGFGEAETLDWDSGEWVPLPRDFTWFRKRQEMR